MDKIIVSLSGAVIIGLIYWFFFAKKENVAQAGDELTIIVDGGYKPDVIRLREGHKTTLTFIRKDSNSCLEDLIIPDYKIKKYLPMNTPVDVTLSPTKKGITDFHCGMNMFFGKLEVI